MYLLLHRKSPIFTKNKCTQPPHSNIVPLCLHHNLICTIHTPQDDALSIFIQVDNDGA